ncbi:hypothetical protein BRAS3843_50021 [Bradyrhizobium sp. STM 3843]|uniref:hypothetical protein n=1 Tax=Bradyrhizobium sp. STM 3843 TaxID=551947 RepID=UPI0002404396|nr:hypothetical protein [Bradyrhizobium sp. STM 3843]CCE10419.1 hypothetical protein BRAS3843_50021 [Bradyrhizobium sp. STM 3843]
MQSDRVCAAERMADASTNEGDDSVLMKASSIDQKRPASQSFQDHFVPLQHRFWRGPARTQVPNPDAQAVARIGGRRQDKANSQKAQGNKRPKTITESSSEILILPIINLDFP